MYETAFRRVSCAIAVEMLFYEKIVEIISVYCRKALAE